MEMLNNLQSLCPQIVEFFNNEQRFSFEFGHSSGNCDPGFARIWKNEGAFGKSRKRKKEGKND